MTITTLLKKQMTKTLTCLASTCLFAFSANAQEKNITLSFPTAQDAEGCELYITPLEIDNVHAAVKMENSGASFKVSAPASSVDLYNLTIIRNKTQLISAISTDPQSKDVTIPVKFDGNFLMVTNTEENKALSAFRKCEYDVFVNLWDGDKETEHIKGMIKSLRVKADSILNVHSCNKNTAEYIKIWAYTTAANAFGSLPNVLRCKASELPFKREDVLEGAEKVLDKPMATLFYSAPGIISSSIPMPASLAEQLDWLHKNFKCESIINKVSTSLLERFISRFDYAGKYEKGLEEMKAVTERYSLDKKFLNKFIANKVTVPGNLFPEGLSFTDKEGKTHTISEFKGKYVFIDLWASWCVPCCKEVPHLQALEKELQNKDVVFLSISIDSKKEPWLKKMNELKMHGNQWHDASSSLSKALNVQGIPFFVIYDKEGKLHTYNAPRPSHPQTKNFLEELK